MILKGIRKYPLQGKFNDHFDLSSTVELSADDLEAINESIKLLIYHEDMPKLRKRKLYVVISHEDTINLKFFPTSQGEQFNLACIRYSSFREYTKKGTIVVLVEEFVHHFWDSDDELYVKEKVCEIVPGVRLNDSKDKYLFD